MDVTRVREIFKAKSLQGYTVKECRAADDWVRRQAMTNFHKKVAAIPQPYRDYLKLMVRCHYSSVETNQLLTELDCYHKFD